MPPTFDTVKMSFLLIKLNKQECFTHGVVCTWLAGRARVLVAVPEVCTVSSAVVGPPVCSCSTKRLQTFSLD